MPVVGAAAGAGVLIRSVEFTIKAQPAHRKANLR